MNVLELLIAYNLHFSYIHHYVILVPNPSIMPHALQEKEARKNLKKPVFVKYSAVADHEKHI